jgi:aspartate racemase
MRIYSKFYLNRGGEVLHTLEYHAMREVNDEAERIYTPQVYPGEVILFKAANPVDAHTSSVAPDGGWGKLVTGGMEIYDVPGDHLSILQEPNVKVLAERLKICLAKAQAATSLPN